MPISLEAELPSVEVLKILRIDLNFRLDMTSSVSTAVAGSPAHVTRYAHEYVRWPFDDPSMQPAMIGFLQRSDAKIVVVVMAEKSSYPWNM